MKKFIKNNILLLAINLFSFLTLNAQNLPLGSWTFITDVQGNSYNSEKMVQGRSYTKAVFNFVSATNYEFSLVAYDSLTGKSAQVTETGSYSFTGKQFTLQPKTSETVFGNGGNKSFNTRKINNSLLSVIYDWQLEGVRGSTKIASLVVTPMKSGYREGEFYSTKARGVSNPGPAIRRKATARAL